MTVKMNWQRREEGKLGSSALDLQRRGTGDGRCVRGGALAGQRSTPVVMRPESMTVILAWVAAAVVVVELGTGW